MRECRSCGSRANETPFPERGCLCCDCKAEEDRGHTLLETIKRTVQTRASYRAALRHRQNSDQLDLVDLIVRTP